MDRLDAMAAFVRVVERKSFTLAAQDLRLPRSTVTEAVKRLETRLGVQLLVRTTRHVNPTPDGDACYERCLRLLTEVEDLESSLSGSRPRGVLRVDVQGTLARHFLLPRLQDFLHSFPDITLHLGEGERFVDLVREGVDCVLRSGMLADSDMISRRVASLTQVTVASPAYLERHGEPGALEDLDEHYAVGFFSTAAGAVLPLEFVVGGEVVTRSPRPSLSVNGADTYAEAARLGLGIVQAPRYRFETDLASGRIVEILTDFPPPDLPVSLLYPRSHQLSPRVRAFRDWTIGAFRSPAA